MHPLRGKTPAAGSINNGQTLCVLHTISAINSTTLASVTPPPVPTVTAPSNSSGGGGTLSGWLPLLLAVMSSLQRVTRRYASYKLP